jgi:hypothetical protein
MSFKLSYSSIVKTELVANSMFGGSSKLRLIDGELIDVSKKAKISGRKKKGKSTKPKDQSSPIPESSEKTEERKTFRLNKSKVKKKCHAFSRLEKSKKFLAFYSISFPCGLPDENAYKIFNTWLTRCRKSMNLNSYLWVAERQKNGTIHYHLLTNDFMSIKQVNGFMGTALMTEKKKGVEALKKIDIDKYNGVDVKKVGQSKNGLISYLAKYVTKNEVEFYRLPWHCSRDVSRLFTSINYDDEEQDKYWNQLPESSKHYNVKFEEYYKVAGFMFKPKTEIYEDLDIINEIIYNQNNN